MVKDKKLLLVKVDTFENVLNAFTKSVRTEKFSWCRETMGFARLDQLLISLVTPCVERKQVEECWVCVIFFPRLGGGGAKDGRKT